MLTYFENKERLNRRSITDYLRCKSEDIIGRRFEGHIIGCFFTEKEVAEVLVIANSHLIIMLSSVSKHFQNQEVRSKVQLLSEKCLTLTNLYLKNKQSN